jgi:hypothetical protein
LTLNVLFLRLVDPEAEPVPATNEVPAVVPHILTEAEQLRITKLENQLMEFKAVYLLLQKDLEQVNENSPPVLAEVERLMSLIKMDSIKFDEVYYLTLLKEAVTAISTESAIERYQFFILTTPFHVR